MKIVRFGLTRNERPGLLGPDGVMRDLSALVPDKAPGDEGFLERSLSPSAVPAGAAA